MVRAMKSLGVMALVCLASCGDNSKQCGPGTTENNGVCEPDGAAGLICGDGTILDELTDECVPDPSVCGGGTVLINGTCQDPTEGFPIDLMEGPEPNGFEVDATPAGFIVLKDIGSAFVLKGCVTPTGNNSPDLDVYEFDVAAPTLLHITADGVEGLAAGFLVSGDAPQLSSWFRLGLNISTDTSKREVFLPVAGHYHFVMTDTRTLLPLTQNGEGFPAAGNPDGTSCYFVTINQRAIPSATALDLDTPTTGTIGEELKFFTGTFPTGLNTMVAVIDPEDLDGDGFVDFDALGNPIDSRAASSIVLINNSQLRQINDADAASPVSSALFGGIKAGDAPIIVLDYVWNYAVGPADFKIEVLDHTSSQALSTTGTAVNATSNGQFFVEDGEAVFDNMNLFHFDVTATGEIDTMDIAFSIPVQGSLIDQDGQFVSPFTGLATIQNGVSQPNTFTSYKGLIRPFAPGRHYFFVSAPRNPVGTSFTVTSTIAPLVPTAITTGTPTTPVAFNAVRSNMFSYDAGTEPWHTFNATGDATVGALAVKVFDPAVGVPQTPGFAFGRLDPLQTTLGNGAPTTRQPDSTPLLAPIFPTTGASPVHVILENPFAALPPAATDLLVQVNPSIASPVGTFSMSFSARVYEDFAGPFIAAGQSRTANLTMTAGSQERFYFETTPGNLTTIAVQPTGTQALLDVVIEILAGNETVIATINAAGLNAGETLVRSQNLSGAVAFRVRGATGNSAGAYSVQVTMAADDYTASQAPSGFADACVGGTVVPLFADTSGNPADDEGLSGPIAAPSGFTIHGTAATSFKVSSNGFLTFDPSLVEALFDNTQLIDTSSIAIAPHWDDLGNVKVCTKTTSTKRIVQWEGIDFDSFGVVQFQAILDGSGKITFVYGPAHQADGSSATVGVQEPTGTEQLELGFLTAVEVPASSITLTPN